MRTNEIKALVPSYYTEQEKDKIVLLLIDLAHIYLEIIEEE